MYFLPLTTTQLTGNSIWEMAQTGKSLQPPNGKIMVGSKYANKNCKYFEQKKSDNLEPLQGEEIFSASLFATQFTYSQICIHYALIYLFAW